MIGGSSHDCAAVGHGKYNKLAERELAGDLWKWQYYSSIAVEGKLPAYICRKGSVKMMKKKMKRVPKGYLPVLTVGNIHDKEGDDVSCGYWQVYVIRVCVLGHPLLGDLLERSCQQFGYSQYPGALKLPCDAHTFENLLTLISTP